MPFMHAGVPTERVLMLLTFRNALSRYEILQLAPNLSSLRILLQPYLKILEEFC